MGCRWTTGDCMGEHRAIALPLAQTYNRQCQRNKRIAIVRKIVLLWNKHPGLTKYEGSHTLRCGHSSFRIASSSDDLWHRRCSSKWMNSGVCPFLRSSKQSHRTGLPMIHRVEEIPWMHCRKLEESPSCECRRTQRMLSDVNCQPAIFWVIWNERRVSTIK